VRGAEVGGLIGWADCVTGAQVNGLLSVTSRTLTGFQLAPIAMADEIRGAQVGTVAIAGDVHGAQVGLVSVARTSDASVGLVTIVTQGRTTLHGALGSDGIASVAVQHGSRLVHNYSGGAFSFGGKSVGFGPLIGIGLHAYEDAGFFVAVDVLATVLFSSGSGDPQSDYQARAVAGLRLSPSFALYAGPFYDAHFVPDGQTTLAYDGAFLTQTSRTGGGTLHLSPGLVVGARGL
jgi:hypothetical protein